MTKKASAEAPAIPPPSREARYLPPHLRTARYTSDVFWSAHAEGFFDPKPGDLEAAKNDYPEINNGFGARPVHHDLDAYEEDLIEEIKTSKRVEKAVEARMLITGNDRADEQILMIRRLRARLDLFHASLVESRSTGVWDVTVEDRIQDHVKRAHAAQRAPVMPMTTADITDLAEKIEAVTTKYLVADAETPAASLHDTVAGLTKADGPDLGTRVVRGVERQVIGVDWSKDVKAMTSAPVETTYPTPDSFDRAEAAMRQVPFNEKLGVESYVVNDGVSSVPAKESPDIRPLPPTPFSDEPVAVLSATPAFPMPARPMTDAEAERKSEYHSSKDHVPPPTIWDNPQAPDFSKLVSNVPVEFPAGTLGEAMQQMPHAMRERLAGRPIKVPLSKLVEEIREKAAVFDVAPVNLAPGYAFRNLDGVAVPVAEIPVGATTYTVGGYLVYEEPTGPSAFSPALEASMREAVRGDVEDQETREAEFREYWGAPPPFTSAIDHPAHYNMHPSGVECIDIVEAFNFNVGNAVKYLWRAGWKPGAYHLDDLKKARWYVDREIARLERAEAEYGLEEEADRDG